MKYIVSVSGGKDSTATLLFMLERVKKEDLIIVFIDTKWEADETYEYLNYLERKLDIEIIRIESEGMFNLCIRYGFMPNRVMRFCTENLKIKPFNKWLYENFVSKNIDFILVEGIRRKESKSRADTETFEIKKQTYNRKSFYTKKLYPIAYWNKERVFKYIEEKGLKINPLYKMGFNRVGCMPCIFDRKSLIYMPEKYKKRLRELEKVVSKKIGKEVKFFALDVEKYLEQNILFDLFDLFPQNSPTPEERPGGRTAGRG